MNQELIDRIQQDAVTIQRLTADLDSIKQEQARNYNEKLQAEELRYSRLLSETSAKLIGCEKRIDSLENQLETVRKCARTNRWTEEEPLADFIFRTAEDRNEARTRLKAIYDAANALGRGEHESDESVSAFMLRLSGLVTKEQQNVADARNKADDAQRELAKSISLANERALAIGKLRGTHADDIARIDKVSAQLAEIEDEATECGRDEGESVPKFMSRLVIELGDERASSMAMSKALAASKEDVAREHERCNRINSEYEASMANIMAAANKLGRADYEAPDAFMKRQDAAITGLKSDVLQVYAVSDTLGRTSSESIPDFMKRQHAEIEKEQQRNAHMAERLSLVMQDYQDKSQHLLKVHGWHEDNLEKIKSLDGYCARLQSSITEACEIAKANGRTETESLGWFVDRICAESKRKDQTVARLQKVLTAIHDAAKAGGLKQGEKIGAFIERLNEDMYKVRCDAASESMKMGNTNKRLQHAYDEADEERKVSKRFHALAVEERNNAQEEVNRLSAELASTTKRLQTGEACWNTYAQVCNFATSCGMTGDESVKQFIERKIIEASTVTADRERIRAELAAILAEANKSGRCNGDPVQLIKAGQNDLNARISADREADDIKRRWRSLNEHAALKGMRGDETTAEFITRQHRLAADRQTALARASETIATLTSDLTSAIVDKALAGNGAKEINRLSALVAGLQVELDDARGQYGGIMAQLGNETPLQLIERMQRLAQDRRASTIPHDERAMLVAESADLRKRLEASQKAHAKTEHELGGKLRAALATVENQSAAIAEAKQATEKYTAVVEAADKLKEWASTIRHKVLVAMVHTRAMAEYDTIMKELDGKAGTDGR